MGKADDDPDDDAIGWVLRLPTADAATWQRFTEWLEASSRHGEAYDRVSLLGEGLAPGGFVPRVDRSRVEHSPRRLG